MKKKVKRLLCVCCFILCLISLFACGTAADDSMVGRWETVIEDEELGSVMMVYHFTHYYSYCLTVAKFFEIILKNVLVSTQRFVSYS